MGYTSNHAVRLAKEQIWYYLRYQLLGSLGAPEWYETRRKTTHVIFWS